jgi:F-type H+-transporting ATPase subunit epsilon
MAQSTFRCRLITPEAQVFDQPAVAAVLPVWDGQMGILANRAPIVAKLGIGELRLDFADPQGAQGASRSFLVEEGFAHMVHNTLTILASKAVPAERLTEAEAQAEVSEAEARRTDGISDPAQLERIRNDRLRAQTRLRIAREFKARGGGI